MSVVLQLSFTCFLGQFSWNTIFVFLIKYILGIIFMLFFVVICNHLLWIYISDVFCFESSLFRVSENPFRCINPCRNLSNWMKAVVFSIFRLFISSACFLWLAADILSDDKDGREKYHITEIIIDHGLLKLWREQARLYSLMTFAPLNTEHPQLLVSYIVI